MVLKEAKKALDVPKIFVRKSSPFLFDCTFFVPEADGGTEYGNDKYMISI
jgi:hypothetical protein